MAASSSLPHLAVLIVFLLVLVTSAVPATAGGGDYSGATRMVIIRGPAGARSNEWQQQYRRLVEDEVAPEELGGMHMLLGADSGIGYGAFDKDSPACPKGPQPCAAKGPGQPYTRGCTYQSQCPHTPTPAGVAN